MGLVYLRHKKIPCEIVFSDDGIKERFGLIRLHETVPASLNTFRSRDD